MGEHPCWDDAKASTVCSRRTGGRSGFRKTRSMPAWARSVTKLFGDGDLEGMYPGLHCAGQGGGLALCGPGDGESRPRASELAALADERDSVAAVLRRSQRRGSGGSAMFRSALESGVAVAGPPIRPLIALVTPDEIRDAIASVLCKYWPALLDKRDWLVPSGHQSYIVLTCCRALYTLKYGEIKSKQVSAQWALKASGKRWQNLIENALVWHYGIPYGDIEKTLQMMKYTLGKAEAYRARLPDSL